MRRAFCCSRYRRTSARKHTATICGRHKRNAFLRRLIADCDERITSIIWLGTRSSALKEGCSAFTPCAPFCCGRSFGRADWRTLIDQARRSTNQARSRSQEETARGLFIAARFIDIDRISIHRRKHFSAYGPNGAVRALPVGVSGCLTRVGSLLIFRPVHFRFAAPASPRGPSLDDVAVHDERKRRPSHADGARTSQPRTAGPFGWPARQRD
jgi:hypothetical protein